jgi:hypothetical protein
LNSAISGGAKKGHFLKTMVKMNSSVDLNETHVSFVEHNEVCVQKNLFSLVNSLHRKIFSF